jgi:hypothetical protein
MEAVDDKIRVKQVELQVENDPLKKQQLQVQLRKLQFEKEIQTIKMKIEQLG